MSLKYAGLREKIDGFLDKGYTVENLYDLFPFSFRDEFNGLSEKYFREVVRIQMKNRPVEVSVSGHDEEDDLKRVEMNLRIEPNNDHHISFVTQLIDFLEKDFELVYYDYEEEGDDESGVVNMYSNHPFIRLFENKYSVDGTKHQYKWNFYGYNTFFFNDFKKKISNYVQSFEGVKHVD